VFPIASRVLAARMTSETEPKTPVAPESPPGKASRFIKLPERVASLLSAKALVGQSRETQPV